MHKLDLDLVEMIADMLGTSSTYLLGMTDISNYTSEIKKAKYFENVDLLNILLANEKKRLPKYLMVLVYKSDT